MKTYEREVMKCADSFKQSTAGTFRHEIIRTPQHVRVLNNKTMENEKQRNVSQIIIFSPQINEYIIVP